jgi:cardiolipin synthase
MNFNLLHNGTEAFPEIVRLIQKAESSIQIKMFVWRDDAIGNELLRQLKDAADRGVRITIWKDRFAEVLEKGEENKQSLFHKPFRTSTLLGAMILDVAYPMNKPKGYRQKPNALLEAFLAHENVTVHKDADLKDHTKFYIFDDRTVVFGGINVEDKEYTEDYLHRRYHDYMIETTSEAFVETLRARVFDGALDDGSDPSLSLNRQGVFEIPTSMRTLFRTAKERIVVTMAYFGAKDAFEGLCEAASRGVKIDILTSKRANLQPDYNRKFLQELYLLYPGQVTIRLSEDMIHAKAVLADDVLSIGSANLNNRGYQYLGELNLVTRDKNLIEQFLASREKEAVRAKVVVDRKDLDYVRWKAFLERYGM